MSGSSSFLDFPIDLLQTVVELAAESDSTLRVACFLSLVSHQIQQWSDKYLFRHILLSSKWNDGPSGLSNPMLRFVDDLISIVPSPRIEKARKYIRTLATKQSSDPGGRILRIIRVCPHIVSVALWALQFSDNFKDIEIPSLRRFTFHAYSRSLSFLCPFFASITHLELAGPDAGEWDAFFDAGLSDAPSLTHLVLSIKHNDEYFQHFLGIITPYISARLQLLLLLMDEHHAAGSVWHPNSYDIRLVPAFSEEPDWDTTDPVANILVVDVFTGGFEVWTGNVPEEETFWARGMKVVEERRKTLTYTETKVD